MKKQHGFTLVELVVVMVIVGILSVVSVPIYRAYVQRAVFTEADTLMGNIQLGQAAHYSTHGTFVGTKETEANLTLRVDTHRNKYFTSFKISTSKDSRNPNALLWEAVTVGSGKKAVGLTAIGRASNYGELNVTLHDEGGQIEIH